MKSINLEMELNLFNERIKSSNKKYELRDEIKLIQ
jgi:hypothetical protein